MALPVILMLSFEIKHGNQYIYMRNGMGTFALDFLRPNLMFIHLINCIVVCYIMAISTCGNLS